jgi:hypothetical protein
MVLGSTHNGEVVSSSLTLATKIREYIDTQAVARSSQMDASGLA